MGVKLGKTNALRGEGVQIRGVDLAAKRTHVCVAHVIGQNNNDVGRSSAQAMLEAVMRAVNQTPR